MTCRLLTFVGIFSFATGVCFAAPKPAPEPPKAKVVKLPKKKSRAAVPAPATDPTLLPNPVPQKKRTTPADPLKPYMTKVKAALGSRWETEIKAHLAEIESGNLTMTFKLDAEGKVTEVNILTNTSNEAFAKFCEDFIRNSVFEAPPAKTLVDGQLEIPFTFKVY